MTRPDYSRISRADLGTALVVSAMVVGSLTFGGLEVSRYLGLDNPALPAVAMFANYVMAVGAGVTALVIAWFVRGQVGARLLALHLGLIAVTAGLMHNASGDLSELQRILGVAGGALVLPALVHFTLAFPRRLDSSTFGAGLLGSVRGWVGRRPAIIWLAFLPYGVGIYFLHRAHGIPYSLMLTNVRLGVVRMSLVGLLLWTIAALVLAGYNLSDGYRTADGRARARAMWVVLGYLASGMIGVTTLAVSLAVTVVGTMSWLYVISWVWWITLPVATMILAPCLLVAVFGSGAFSPAKTVRRTAVYGGVAVILTCLFAGIEEVLSSSILVRLGLPPALSTWIGAGAIALALNPVRVWIDGIVGSVSKSVPEDPASQPSWVDSS